MAKNFDCERLDTMGHAQAIWLDHTEGLLMGGGDPRADGPAQGV